MNREDGSHNRKFLSLAAPAFFIQKIMNNRRGKNNHQEYLAGK